MTTAGDVGHYFVALLNGGDYQGHQVISPGSIEQMCTPEPASGAEEYGFGWGWVKVPGMRLLSTRGYRWWRLRRLPGSHFLVAPDRRVAIGVLANMSSLDKVDPGHPGHRAWRRAAGATDPARLA